MAIFFCKVQQMASVCEKQIQLHFTGATVSQRKRQRMEATFQAVCLAEDLLTRKFSLHFLLPN